MSNNKPNESLSVNKIGKNIKKSQFNQPDIVNNNNNNNNNQTKQKPQPHVYNINKNDFRNFVQQVTGSPSHHDQLPKPENYPPRHPSMRLQKIRPPPLNPISQARVPEVARLVQPSPRPGLHPPVPALSPISAFMQQLETCIGDQGPRTPGMVRTPETQMSTQPDLMQTRFQEQAQSQQLGSPSGVFNLLSPIPLSPYNFLSPGVQYQPPLSPIFAFSSIGQSAALQTPFSPGFVFPQSPSGFFPVSSPWWRNQ